MAHEIPFSQSKFKVPDALIPGNSTSDTPVIFHLSPAQGPDKARLKSAIFATLAVSDPSQEWSKDIQDAVIAAYGRGGEVFVRCVDKIEGLTVPATLAKRALIIPPDQHDSIQDSASIPVKSGTDFAMISGYVISLSFLVAMEIAKLGKEMEDVDQRFFGRPSGSRSETPAAATPGTVASVPTRRGRRGTAGLKP